MIFTQVGEARVLEREVVESELTFAGFAVCVQCLFLWLFSLQFHRLMDNISFLLLQQILG
jgi:hypothetical protein